MFKRIGLVLLFVPSFTLVSSAQQIVTDRPDQTEASSTVPQGSFQWECGLVLQNTETALFREQSLAAPSNLFRIGITKWFELRIFNQYETYKNRSSDSKNVDSGFNDIEIGTKIQLFKKDAVNTEVAFMTHAILPTGDSFFSIDDYGTINKLLISHSITETIGIGYNLGYNYYGIGDGDANYSLAIGIVITDKVSLYAEPYGEFVEFEEHISNFDAGVTYLLKDNFQLDYSFGLGLNNDMNYMSIGFSWNVANSKN